MFTTSEFLGRVELDGYLVNNNVHKLAAARGTQKIEVYSTAKWTVTADFSSPDVPKGSIKSYPCTQKNFTNRTIDSFSEIKSTFDMTNPDVGEWNGAYDLWTGAWGGITGEVMVWTDWHRYNGKLPPPNAVESTKVVIDGQEYIAWKRPLNKDDVRPYIALASVTHKAAGDIDLLKVLQFIVDKGWLKAAEKIAAIEYGVEIANTITPAGGPQTFRLNDFTLTTQ